MCLRKKGGLNVGKNSRLELIKQLEQLSKENEKLKERVQKLEKQKSDEKPTTTQKLLFATALMNFLKILYEILDKFF